MLGWLRRLLGWDGHAGPLDLECLEGPIQPPPPWEAELAKPLGTRALPREPDAERAAGRFAAGAQPEEELALEDPELSLDTRKGGDTRQSGGVNPYDTGTFNTSAVWDELSKKRNG